MTSSRPQPPRMVVCGDDTLLVRLLEELAMLDERAIAVVPDGNPEVVRLVTELGVEVVIGSPTDAGTLLSAGIERARALALVGEGDEKKKRARGAGRGRAEPETSVGRTNVQPPARTADRRPLRRLHRVVRVRDRRTLLRGGGPGRRPRPFDPGRRAYLRRRRSVHSGRRGGAVGEVSGRRRDQPAAQVRQ
ncbi:NAD-binding protein [Fodinicola feengrottensis]|uniref:NAD-binding protein n=1 Tax=Fodinicola feengrottensis TaxID=435914 RepID=UPI0013D0651D|nr:NAD-binding protein [Fodinicola feengrottensis]